MREGGSQARTTAQADTVIEEIDAIESQRAIARTTPQRHFTVLR